MTRHGIQPTTVTLAPSEDPHRQPTSNPFWLIIQGQQPNEAGFQSHLEGLGLVAGAQPTASGRWLLQLNHSTSPRVNYDAFRSLIEDIKTVCRHCIPIPPDFLTFIDQLP
jgi:hypothetical protein